MTSFEIHFQDGGDFTLKKEMEVFRTRSVGPVNLLKGTQFLGLVLFVIFPSTISHQDRNRHCNTVPRSMSLPVLEKEGNIVLGGLFSLHDMVLEPTLSFTSTPPTKECTRQAIGKLVNDNVMCHRRPANGPALIHCRFNFRTFRWMQTMIFAIEEINRNSELLPNVTLGYKIYDSCSTPHKALKASIELMAGEKYFSSHEGWQSNQTCHGTIPVVIGDGGSTQSLVVARFLGVFDVPQVSAWKLDVVFL